MILPDLPEVDPGENPDAFVKALISRYFSPGWLDRLIRTWVPIAIGTVLAWLNAHYGIVGDSSPSTTTVVAGLIIAGYYLLASLVEKNFPALGRWLVALNLVRTHPVYVDETTHQAVRDVAYGDYLRRSMQ